MIYSFRLKIEQYPGWRMVTCVYLPTRPSVYTAVHESVRHLRREQKVIESHAFVLLPPFIFVIPECPERPVRMQPPHRVCPALSQQTRKGLAAFGLDQRVVIQRSSRIDVLRCRHDVVVTGQYYGGAAGHEFGGVGNEALKPCQLIVEFRSRLRIPVGEVDGSDEHSLNSRFDVAGLVIFRISRQGCAGQHGSLVSRENGHAVPGTLPLPDCFVPESSKGIRGKGSLLRLELLETNHVRLSFSEPSQE